MFNINMRTPMILTLIILYILYCNADDMKNKVYEKENIKEFTLPQKFGNYSLSSLSSAPPCGTDLASYNGISSYSNGDYQGTGDSCSGWSSTGLQFQCVEYTQRYFNAVYGTAPVWPVDFAIQMCSSYPDGITPVGNPGVGLGVVFNFQPYGHTAVVIGASDSTIDVIEQNGSPSGVNTYYQSDVLCYLST